LVGTTDKMIESIRSRTHWNMKNLKAKDVVLLGLCTQSQFNEVISQLETEKENQDKAAAKKGKK
jgi:uncharacterized protein